MKIPDYLPGNSTNMEQTEKAELLGRKKHLEERIAKNRDILDANLKDEGPKLPNWKENLEKVRAIIADAERDLAEVKGQLSQLPPPREGWAVFPRPLNGAYPRTIHEEEAEAEEALAKMPGGGVGHEVRRARWVEDSRDPRGGHAEPLPPPGAIHLPTSVNLT